MSRFFSEKHNSLTAYTPGEQPKNREYIKLNTNESPFAPSKGVLEAVKEQAELLNLYSDPECTELNKFAASVFGVDTDRILMTNGSDEILNFAFMAFGDKDHPFAFPDITYGFYPVFAKLNGVPYKEIPLKPDFSVDVADYENIGMNIVIANPNAPTGLMLSLSDVERIVSTNPDNVVIIDEAYIDFGGESALPLIEKYDNLLVVQTFSKSRSLAGMRIGYAMGNPKLIKYINDVKYSFNSYTMNQTALELGVAAVEDKSYFEETCKKVIATREWVKEDLKKLGFFFGDSMSNFVFAKHEKIPAVEIFEALKKENIFVRHFTAERISNYLRISIGTDEEMKELICQLEKIVKKQ